MVAARRCGLLLAAIIREQERGDLRRTPRMPAPLQPRIRRGYELRRDYVGSER